MDENQVIHQDMDQSHEQETTQVSQTSTPPAPPAPEREYSQDFRNLRTAKERLEYENRELQARIKRIEDEKKKQQDAYAPDDLVERSYVDQQLSETKKEMQRMSAEYRLKSNYPDFDKVVNESTIAKLKEKNATIAAAIGQVPDAYSQAAAAYEAIKSMGIYEVDIYSAEREQAQENANKPRPLQSIAPQKGDSAVSTSAAFGEAMNDDRKKQVWREMQHYMKQPRD